jgi:hypothetical protein
VQVGTLPTITMLGVPSETLSSGMMVTAGQHVVFEATAVNEVSGDDLSAQLVWTEAFLHDDHTHPQGVQVRGLLCKSPCLLLISVLLAHTLSLLRARAHTHARTHTHTHAHARAQRTTH